MRAASRVLFAIACLASTADAQVRVEYSEVHMGVPVRIVMYAPDEPTARAAARAAFDRIAELDDVLSNYRDASEVRQLERRGGEWVPVSADLFDVLARSLVMARASDGAFDPTVGPLTDLWREIRRSGALPPRAVLDSARARVGWRKVALDSSRRRVRLESTGMRLDFGAIGKGYAVQAGLDRLRRRGIGQALLEAGGDIVVGDAPPGHQGWVIEAPAANDEVRRAARSLTNAALSTSGSVEQYVMIDGVRYSHVVDPRTGLGVTHADVVSVVAADGALADALATAIGVMSRDLTVAFIAAFPGAVVSISRSRE